MIYMVHGANAEQVREILDQGTCVDAVYETHGHMLEDYTAYDRGDLCHEIDFALGDLIERTMHRYMSKEEAQVERRNSISDFADKVIARDKAHGKSNNNSAEAQPV